MTTQTSVTTQDKGAAPAKREEKQTLRPALGAVKVQGKKNKEKHHGGKHEPTALGPGRFDIRLFPPLHRSRSGIGLGLGVGEIAEWPSQPDGPPGGARRPN